MNKKSHSDHPNTSDQACNARREPGLRKVGLSDLPGPSLERSGSDQIESLLRKYGYLEAEQLPVLPTAHNPSPWEAPSLSRLDLQKIADDFCFSPLGFITQADARDRLAFDENEAPNGRPVGLKRRPGAREESARLLKEVALATHRLQTDLEGLLAVATGANDQPLAASCRDWLQLVLVLEDTALALLSAKSRAP